MTGEQGADVVGQIQVDQVVGREVDRDAQFVAVRPPDGARGERPVEHGQSEGTDEPGALRQADELLRCHLAVHRVVPAGQRLGAGDGPVVHGRLRLDLDRQLVEQDGLAQVGLQGQPFGAVGVQDRVVDTGRPASRRFRRVHGDVGLRQQPRGGGRVLRRQGDPERRI